LNTNI